MNIFTVTDSIYVYRVTEEKILRAMNIFTDTKIEEYCIYTLKDGCTVL